MEHKKHGDIIDGVVELTDGKITKKKVTDLLEKYGIDINYDNSLILVTFVSKNCREEINDQDYKSMGLDPTSVPSESHVRYHI